MLKNLPHVADTCSNLRIMILKDTALPWKYRIPQNSMMWEKAMAPLSSTLAWKIPWTEESSRLQSLGSLRVGHDWAAGFTFTFHFYTLEKEMTTHSSALAWRIPGTEEPGGLLSMGSHRVGHDWSNLAAVAAAWCVGNEKGINLILKILSL